MISRNYLSVQDNPIYRVGLRDYARIKDWLEKCKQNYQNLPTLSSSIEYYPLNYVFTFKRITLSQIFIDKYLRIVNSVASNGLKLLAGVFNSKENIYIAKSYEKKGLFCKFDLRTRVLELFEEITLAFFTLGEREAGINYSVITEVSPNVKPLFFFIQFDLISNDGQIFHLGQIKYSLTNRNTKQTVSDLEIIRLGQKQNIGYAQVHIETPQRLGLSYFLPANHIIDPSAIVPPCKSIKVKDKAAPYTLLPSYNICIEDLELTINNYDRLLHSLKRCSPYFTNYHHDHIKVQISKITLLMGFHNSYMLLNDLPVGKEKQRQRQKLRESPKNSPGKSRVFNSFIESKQIKKNIRVHYVYKASKMIVTQGNQNNNQTKNLTLKAYQLNSISSDRVSQFVVNEPKNSINLLYFDTDGGHLIGVLQFTIKFTLQATIKQQNTMKMNIFWTPLTFDAGEPITQVRIPMIEHIQLPGYPIEWNEVNDNKNMISAILNYRCINNNPQLWQNIKKQRIRTFKTISGTRIPTQNQIAQKTYYDLLIQQLDDKEKQENISNIMANNLLKTQSVFRAYTQTSLAMKEEQVNNNIQKMLRTLEKSLKPRLKIRQNQFGISPDLLIPKLIQIKPVPGLSLIGKSYQINVRLRQYLPMTDSPEQYYIPRKMLIKIYGFRQTYEQIVFINKDSVKAGIPIQLQHPTKIGYEGFVFQFNLNNITEQQAGAYEQGNSIVVMINDLENMQYYGSGDYPSIQLFDLSSSESQESGNTGMEDRNKIKEKEKKSDPKQNSKYIRIKINSKLVNETSSIRGYLLMQGTIMQKKQGQQANNPRPQQINLQKIVKQISTKERQMLRINVFNGKQQANTKKDELISNYKKKNKQSFVKQIALKQYNNDLQTDYEIGKPTYAWIKLNNTDKSQNNLFAFYFDCDFIELVTDKQVYQRMSLVEAKKGQLQSWKNMPSLTYVLNKQGRSHGHYQARITQGSQADILIKILHNQWIPSSPEVTIAKIQVRRNTFLFKQFKLRLNLKKPLIDQAYHIQTIWLPNFSQIKVKIPHQIVSENGDFINTLSPNTLINVKENVLKLSKISQQSIPQQGLIIYVLLGAYYDKLCQSLKRSILIELECMQGEKIKMNIGDLEKIKIPMMGDNLRANESIYRVQLSNDEYQLKWQKYGRLNFYSKTSKNQPQLMLRCLRPIKDDIVVSIINLQNKLIKKYLIALQCNISTRIPQEIIEVQGFVGEKINFILKNPYHTDFGFYISSTNSGLVFNGIEFEKKEMEEQFIFKIRSKSQIRITTQITQNIRAEEYVILSDFLHHVVTIFIIRLRLKKQIEQSKVRQKSLQSDSIPFFGDDFRNTPKLG